MTETISSIRSLETQIGQHAKLMADRHQGALLSTTEVNPKEQCKAITLRKGTKYDGPSSEDKGERVEEKNGEDERNKKINDDLPKKDEVKQ